MKARNGREFIALAGCWAAAIPLVSLLTAGCSREERVAESQAPPPIILISIDTLRADRLPPWGYRGVQTPSIDALRSEGVLYRNAWSHVPLTLPSHISMLTGRLPYEHTVRDNIGYRFGGAEPSIPRALKQRGYATGAAVSAYVLRGETGLNGAFDFYDDAITAHTGEPVGNLQRPGASTLSVARSWVAGVSGQPFFLLFHIFEPHSPYRSPEPFRSRFSDPYDAEVAAADAVVGELIDYLRQQGVYDRAAIILLSDHGEGLGDHGEGEHGVLLYREALHVPLIIKLPGGERAGETVDTNVQLVDIAPTIAALAGVPFESTHGRSLLERRIPSRPVYSETLYPRLHFGWSELRSLVDGPLHFIEGPKPELYDVAADPSERTNIAATRRRDVATLKTQLAHHPRVEPGPVAVDGETAKKLAALGYIGSGAARHDPTANPRDRIGEIEELRKGIAMEATATPEELVRFYRAVVERNPESIDARGMLAVALERTGRDAEAEREYLEALRRQPRAVDELALALAALQLKMGQFEEAEAHARIALEHHRPRASQILARVAIARGTLDEAERRLGDPGADSSFRSWVVLAQIRAKQGRIGEAAAILQSARARSRAKGVDVELLHLALGDLNFALRRYADAERDFREEIRVFPQHLGAWTGLGRSLAMTGRLEEAEAVLVEMVRRNPGTRSEALAASTRAQLRAKSFSR